jgi:hypothetical protein
MLNMVPDAAFSSQPFPIRKPTIKGIKGIKGIKVGGITGKKAIKSVKRESVLDGYAPGKYDVVCNRSRNAFHQLGNRRFRIIIENHAAAFAAKRLKADRSFMIVSILKTVESAGGKFVAKNNQGQWDTIALVKRKEKVGHALRAAISAMKAHKERSIYNVLGFNRAPLHTTDPPRISPQVIVKAEEEVLFNTVDEISDKVLMSTDKLPSINNVDDDTPRSLSLADALVANLEAQRPTKRQKVDMENSSIPDLCDSSSDEFSDNEGCEVDAVFEMFKVEDEVIASQELKNATAGLDGFFNNSSIFVS